MIAIIQQPRIELVPFRINYTMYNASPYHLDGIYVGLEGMGTNGVGYSFISTDPGGLPPWETIGHQEWYQSHFQNFQPGITISNFSLVLYMYTGHGSIAPVYVQATLNNQPPVPFASHSDIRGGAYITLSGFPNITIPTSGGTMVLAITVS